MTIPFDAVTTFIGPNGSGKSSVLRALDWFFNGKAGALGEEDCSFGATDQPIEVEVTFDDLTGADRAKLGRYAPAESNTFAVRKLRDSHGNENLSANARSYPPFNEIRSKGSAVEKKSAYNALRTSDGSLDLPTCTSVDAVNQAMTAWEAGNPHALRGAPESLQTQFFGFNGAGIMSGLFDFVLVTADLRASEESTDGKASIIGRILERSIDRSAADEEIAKIVEESREKQQGVYRDKFTSQLAEMTRRLNEVVATYSPGRSVAVSAADLELKASRTTFHLAVLDGLTETTVERQGHGFQRTLLISALQHLAQSSSAAEEGVICLAVEEPELFQHPVQAQTFARVLRSLAEDPEKRIQVTYATHSPYFLEARHFDQIRRLTRSIGATPHATVHSTSVAQVRAKLNGTMEEDRITRQLDGIVTSGLSLALFAERALIVEGQTEAAVLYGIGDRNAAGRLESEGIAIVPVGGKGSIPLAHAVLTCLGVPTYVLFDGDGGFATRMRAEGKDEDKIEAQRGSHAQENRKLLKYLGEAEVDFPAESIGENAAMLSDTLESYLDGNWTEWGESWRDVESAAGISLKKNQHAYREATVKAGGRVPLMLEEILRKARGK